MKLQSQEMGIKQQKQRVFKRFSFITLLMTFDSILGLTKPLSDIFH